MKIKFIIIAVTISTILLPAIPGEAAGVPIPPLLHPKGSPKTTGYDEATVRKELLGRITNVILGVAGVVAIFFIIINGWFLIAAAGSEETISQHKKGLMWAVIGLILIILSYSIIRFIISIPFQAQEGPKAPATDASSVAVPQ